MSIRPRFGLLSFILWVVLLFSTFIATCQVLANSSINVEISVFHDALAPYGYWVNHRTYGHVWYPRNVARDWRPYTDGYWAHTDDYGWLWVSNEPWGWAPFHYGRWAWDNWYGWIWVPGQTWAPAWVFWRSGGGYAAWAPMPPNVVWQPGIGLNISYFNYERDLSWDSWVAVREYDLPHRHISRRICPPRQNRQIINVTNYTNNVTIINNTIVNQGVPVKQIEEITRKPVVRVVPKVHNRLDINTTRHHDGQPNIIRLPMAAPTPEEIHHNEELARRLDGKNAEGTRTELPLANSGQSGNQKPRLPGRLAGAPAPVQSPYATPEQPNPLLKEPAEQALPLPVIPETPLVGLSPDSDMQRKKPGVAPMPSLQNKRKPLEPAKQSDQNPVVDQQQIERRQAENLQRQKKIDQLQQELALRQDKQKKQEIKMQQQAERARQEEQQLQQQQQQQQAERAQQMQQQQAARQQEMQNQQQMKIQRQQAGRAREESQQMQQQQTARQQEMQNQQQMKMQRQQAGRAREESQQMQQQQAARRQEMQNQRQMEMQRQQAVRARKEAQQMQKQQKATPPQ